MDRILRSRPVSVHIIATVVKNVRCGLFVTLLLFIVYEMVFQQVIYIVGLMCLDAAGVAK